MERNPKKNFINPEFQDAVKESQENIKLIIGELDESLKELGVFVTHLQELHYHIETMQEVFNENVKLDKLLGTIPVPNQFTLNDIQEAKKKMTEAENMIKNLKREISGWILSKEALSAQIEEFTQLDKDFKNLLLKIKPETLQ